MSTATATRSASTFTSSRNGRLALIVGGSFLVLSISAAISKQHDLTSAFTVVAAIGFLLPILCAGLGGLVSERAGIVNIGLEGMMILGTWGGGFFGYHFGPWGALIGGAACGALGGLLHALATVTFGVDHVISGVAINALAFGWARFLAAALFKGRGAGSETNSPGFDTASAMPTLRMPGFSDTGPIAHLEAKHWPVLSDAAGILRGLLGEWKLYYLIALLLVPFTGWLLWRTKFGLRLRSSGERPSAADSLGVNVARVRYLAVLLSGAMAGVGGALMVLNNNGQYQEGQSTNRGFLGLAALIFGNWRPTGVLGGAALFGFFDSLQLTAAGAVRGLYLAAAAAALFAAVLSWRKGKTRQTAWIGSLAAALLLLFISGAKMNEDLVKALPYFGTLIVLTVFSRRLRPPAAAGQPWRKGQLT